MGKCVSGCDSSEALLERGEGWRCWVDTGCRVCTGSETAWDEDHAVVLLNLKHALDVRAARVLQFSLNAGAAVMCATGVRQMTPMLSFEASPGCCISVVWAREHLRKTLAGSEDALRPDVVDWFDGRPRERLFREPVAMSSPETRIAQELNMPNVHPVARKLWMEGKMLELMSHMLFKAPPLPNGELFCQSYKRAAKDRAERVCKILEDRMADPPTLGELASEVGCSAFYLSRTFSKVMKMTIPQYLRELRIRRAAELLRSGRHNVTEAAFEVGYSSLGHFSTAFCEITGCCPSLYPTSRHLAKNGF